jgi:hypothetical protein
MLGRTLCRISLFGAIFIATVALAGCGGASSPVVVKIGDERSITKAALDHWTVIEALVTYELPLRKRAPKGAVPDPPSYTNCIAYLRKLDAGRLAGVPSAAQLKSECRRQRITLRNQMLEILITSDWLTQEAASKGVKVSDAEVKRALHKKLTTAALQKYLTFGGLSEAEEVFLLKRTMLGNTLREAVERPEHSRAQRQQAFIAFYQGLQRKWTAQTTCRPGYVVSQCREYRAGKT